MEHSNGLSLGRRSFLKGMVGSAVMLSASGLHFTLSATPPSKRVNLALIGCGGRGISLVQDFVHHEEAQFLAVCDCFKDRRENLANDLNTFYASDVVKAYADYQEILVRQDIDAVIIATPDHWHVLIAMDAAKQGKDMYAEKPLGVSMQWAWKLRKIIEQRGTIFQYGTQQRSMPNFRKACELTRNGYLGEIERIDAWCPDMGSQYHLFHMPQFGCTRPAPIPESFDYLSWLGPAPIKPYTLDRCTPYGAYHGYDYALGFIAGWGSHPLDIVQWGIDMDHTSPVRYEGVGSIPEKGLYDSIDSWDMECTYSTGVKIHFMGHRVAEPLVTSYRPWIDHGTTFFGSEGWVSVDRAGIHASDPGLLEINLKEDDIHLRSPRSHAHDFLTCVLNRETPISPFEAALRSDTISHLSDIAIRLERSIEWNPEQEKIVGESPEESLAAHMLDRVSRIGRV